MKTAEDEEFDAITERQKLAFNESANFEPIKKPWVGLTSQHLKDIFAKASCGEAAVLRAAEILRELNTAPQPAAREPLTAEECNLFINGRGEKNDDNYVEPTGDGFGLTDADLIRLIRRVEEKHGITQHKDTP